MSASATMPKSRGPRIAASSNVKTRPNARSPHVMRNVHLSELWKELRWSLMGEAQVVT